MRSSCAGKLYFSLARLTTSSRVLFSFSLGRCERLRRLSQADLSGIPVFEGAPENPTAEPPSGFSPTVAFIGSHLVAWNAGDACKYYRLRAGGVYGSATTDFSAGGRVR